jgi:hypothetical protein
MPAISFLSFATSAVSYVTNLGLNWELSTMDQGSQELRRAAAEAFMQAIAQLETTLGSPATETAGPVAPATQSATQANNTKASSTDANGTPSKFDLDALADAAADIEQFIQTQTQSHLPETEEP